MIWLLWFVIRLPFVLVLSVVAPIVTLIWWARGREPLKDTISFTLYVLARLWRGDFL